MAAFSSNIDITSGGTYGMDVTNGESSLKVANDLNGKMANIQQYLQNGLPEVWTGDSLPDSLPNGKMIQYSNNLYYNDTLLRLLNQNDLANINNDINVVNNNISTQINNSVVFGTITQSGGKEVTINIGKAYRYCIFIVNRIIYNSSGREQTSGGIIFEPNLTYSQYIGLGPSNMSVHTENNMSFIFKGANDMDDIYARFIAFT